MFLKTLGYVCLFTGLLPSAALGTEPADVKMLAAINATAREEDRVKLTEVFLEQFPGHETLPDLYARMQRDLLVMREWDRALEIGDRLLNFGMHDQEALRGNIKAAAAQNDVEGLRQWAERLRSLERAVGRTLAEAADTELLHASQHETDPAKRLQILDRISEKFPRTPHAGQVNHLYFVTYRELKDEPNTVAAAERVASTDLTHEDVLFYLAEAYVREQRDLIAAVVYATAALDTFNERPRPDHIAEADWTAQKATVNMHAQLLIGTVYSWQKNWAAAEVAFRAALDYSKPADATYAQVLTQLGWTNYQLRRIPDALHFYQRSLALPGIHQNSTRQTIAYIKSEYSLQ